MSTTVHLVDASPYIFRAYFSMPDLRTPADEPAGAVHGFASFLVRYLREEEPTHLGIAFDESLNTSFRNELYPEYKAQRELPPAEVTHCASAWAERMARTRRVRRVRMTGVPRSRGPQLGGRPPGVTGSSGLPGAGPLHLTPTQSARGQAPGSIR